MRRVAIRIAGSSDKRMGGFRLLARPLVKRAVWSELRPIPPADHEAPQWSFDSEPSGVSVEPAVRVDLPILRVSWLVASRGGSGTEFKEEHLLLDFRSLPPKAFLRLRCEGIVDPLGMCTAENSRWQPRYRLDCSWLDDRDDFLCDGGATEPRPWVERVFHSRFFLRSEQGISAEEPRTFSDFLQRVERDVGWRRRAIRLPEGVMHHLAHLSGHSGLPSLHLFGTTEGCSDFDMRFFVGVPRGGDNDIQEVLPSGGLESDQPAEGGERFDSCSGASGDSGSLWKEEASTLTHSVKVLYDDRPKLVVLEIFVSEGTGRGLFWIGLEESAGTIRSDVRRLATTAPSVGHCGVLAQPASAVVTDIATGRFSARLDVEPRWIDRREGSRQFEYIPDRCPMIAVLTWETGRGFVTTRWPRACTTKVPRLVEIDDRGQARLREVVSP